MAGRSVDFTELRDEIDAAVAAEIAVGGRERLNKEAIARRFGDRGASRASICRWIDALMSGARSMPGRGGRASASLEPATTPTIASDASPVMSGVMSGPVVAASRSAAVGPPSGGIAVLQRLEDGLRAVEQVMTYARKEDGTVRNAKLLIAAVEQLRRTLDTAVRLRDSLRQDRDIDLFHDAMIAEIEQESSACAQRIHERLGALLQVYVDAS